MQAQSPTDGEVRVVVSPPQVRCVVCGSGSIPPRYIPRERVCPPCGHRGRAEGAGVSPHSSRSGSVSPAADIKVRRVQVRPPSPCGSGSAPPQRQCP